MGSALPYYSILGVDKTADPNAIKKAYRRKAMVLHPDKGGDAEDFKRLNEAYEVLSSPMKREAYDTFGPDALRPGGGSPFSGQQHRYYQQQRSGGGYDTRTNPFPGGGGAFFDMGGMGGGGDGVSGDVNDMINQLFGDIFGGGGGSSRRGQQMPPPPPRPIEQPFQCTLEELVSGCEKKYRVRDSMSIGGRRALIESTFRVKVQPGWKAGTRLTFKPTRSFPKPVVFILQEAKTHALYIRKGDDLILRSAVKITPEQQAQGTTVDLKMVDSSIYKLVITPKDRGVRSGARRILRGKGMPKSRGQGKGDVILTFEC